MYVIPERVLRDLYLYVVFVQRILKVASKVRYLCIYRLVVHNACSYVLRRLSCASCRIQVRAVDFSTGFFTALLSYKSSSPNVKSM
jgi:hypothetical protein